MAAPPPPTSESIALPPFQQLVGRTLGGRYRVVAPLGRGGAGQVFTAVQEPLGREVAVKVLRTDLAEEDKAQFEARFLREAALLSRLRHPALVAVHDFGAEADLRYVVMEKLAGRTLRQAIRQEGGLDPRFVARIGAEIARGLRHAHQAGLVHRDVKPNNVILEPDDDGVEHAKLIDFGLVKETNREEESSITRVGAYLGTPAYMAPEQSRGEAAIDGKADVYALGVLLYQSLVNKLPYDAETALGLAVMHTTEPYPPMSLRAPELAVPAELEGIVRWCLEKERDLRPDMAEVAGRLEGWLQLTMTPPPIRAVAAARPGAEVRWIAGSVAIAIAAMALAGVVTVGSVLGSIWWSWRPAAVEAATLAQLPEPDPILVPEPVLEPVPEPVLVPAPAPEPVLAPAPVPVPDVAVTPRPKPPPRPPLPPPAAATVVADGVRFDAAHAARALQWLNTTDPANLARAGIAPRQASIVTAQRPFPSLEAFAATPQIGEKTLQSVYGATAP